VASLRRAAQKIARGQLTLAAHKGRGSGRRVLARETQLAVLYHFSLQGAAGFPAPMEHEVVEQVQKDLRPDRWSSART